jgi:sigma-E factor negative regulatory protein RseB
MMSVLRRPVLLLSAAVTITVPGVLAVLAVLGHDQVAGMSAGRAEAALGTRAAAAGAEGLKAVPAGRHKGRFMPLAGAKAIKQQATGMRLLNRAAAAGLASSYQGVEMISQWTVDGTITAVSTVWHRGGGLTVTRTANAAALADTQPYLSYDADNHDPEGVFGVTKTLVALLGANYLAEARGTGTVVGRSASIVELHRADGTLAARFWLDQRTMLPLRRELYDSAAHVLSEDVFMQVQFGRKVAQAPVKSGQPVAATWAELASPALLLKELNGQGWRLPAALPGGLSLYAAAKGKTSTGPVVDLGYSDGLFVVSLFVERGALEQMAGWQRVSVSGHPVYVGQHFMTWASRGFVYTVLADAPPAMVDGVVAVLPQETAPGFMTRIGRGLGRLASLANPFK